MKRSSCVLWTCAQFPLYFDFMIKTVLVAAGLTAALTLSACSSTTNAVAERSAVGANDGAPKGEANGATDLVLFSITNASPAKVDFCVTGGNDPDPSGPQHASSTFSLAPDQKWSSMQAKEPYREINVYANGRCNGEPGWRSREINFGTWNGKALTFVGGGNWKEADYPARSGPSNNSLVFQNEAPATAEFCVMMKTQEGWFSIDALVVDSRSTRGVNVPLGSYSFSYGRCEVAKRRSPESVISFGDDTTRTARITFTADGQYRVNGPVQMRSEIKMDYTPSPWTPPRVRSRTYFCTGSSKVKVGSQSTRLILKDGSERDPTITTTAASLDDIAGAKCTVTATVDPSLGGGGGTFTITWDYDRDRDEFRKVKAK